MTRITRSGLWTGLAMMVAVAAACGQPARGPSAHHQASPTPVVATPTPTPVPHVPARLVIPRIKVNANVEQVGMDQNDTMAVPSKTSDVAWYKLGPMPGQPGDAVIDGHLDWYDGPAVFWSLSKLQAGDEIDVIGQDGARLKFEVYQTENVPYTSHPEGLFDASGTPRLSLITCAGGWDRNKKVYSERLIVRAGYVGDA